MTDMLNSYKKSTKVYHQKRGVFTGGLGGGGITVISFIYRIDAQ